MDVNIERLIREAIEEELNEQFSLASKAKRKAKGQRKQKEREKKRLKRADDREKKADEKTVRKDMNAFLGKIAYPLWKALSAGSTEFNLEDMAPATYGAMINKELRYRVSVKTLAAELQKAAIHTMNQQFEDLMEDMWDDGILRGETIEKIEKRYRGRIRKLAQAGVLFNQMSPAKINLYALVGGDMLEVIGKATQDPERLEKIRADEFNFFEEVLQTIKGVIGDDSQQVETAAIENLAMTVRSAIEDPADEANPPEKMDDKESTDGPADPSKRKFLGLS